MLSVPASAAVEAVEVPATPVAGPAERQPAPRRRLSRKYAAYFLVLVTGALLTSSAVNLYLGHRERQAHLHDVQSREARTAATRIEQFLSDVDGQIAWALRPVQAAGAAADEERRAAYLGLLRLNPAITQIRYLDCQGQEQLAVSRVAMERLGAGSAACPAASPGGRQGPSTAATYSPVEFADGYPYVLVTVREGASGGATVAQVNLTFIWDVVSRVTVGHDACAYLLDAGGRLIAHPDVNLVLQRPSVGTFPQVCRGSGSDLGTGRGPGRRLGPAHALGRLLYRREAFSRQERIDPAGWTVVVEHPVEAAIAPLVDALLGTGALLLLGLALSVTASRLLARKMVAPIHALQAGAAWIRAGELEQRIEVRTGDELEVLAGEFNAMAAELKESYAGLEQKVDERTRELTRLFEEIEAASRHKSEFLRKTAHEVRTPLQPLGMTIRNILDGYVSQEQLPDRLLRVHRSVVHLSALADQLLDLGKIEAGKFELVCAPCDLGEIAREVRDEFEALAADKGLRLAARIPPDLPACVFDHLRIRQVLYNLVHNAIKFAETGQVCVEVGRSAGGLVCSVSDSGPGIAPESQHRVFDAYYQVTSTSPGGRQGAGLGLTIAKGMVERHGGRMWLESSPGQGTTVRFSLPLETDRVPA